MAKTTPSLIIEFVSKDDPMSKRLLMNKEDLYFQYTRQEFERLLEQHYHISNRTGLQSGTRMLYYAEKK